jgi:hypothetical protein
LDRIPAAVRRFSGSKPLARVISTSAGEPAMAGFGDIYSAAAAILAG